MILTNLYLSKAKTPKTGAATIKDWLVHRHYTAGEMVSDRPAWL